MKLSQLVVAAVFLVSACTGSTPVVPTPTGSTTSSTAKSGTDTTGSGAPTAQTGGTGTGKASPPSSGGVTTAPSTGAVNSPSTAAPVVSSAIVFTSSDGSAFPGSRVVFTVTDTATGKSFTTPVNGTGKDTRTQVQLKAGTYLVTSTDRYAGTTSSYAVRNVTPAQVTVGNDPAQPSTVDYGLDVAQSPFDLAIDNATPTSIEVSWELLAGAQLSGYQLRRTNGAVAATSGADGVAVVLKDSTTTSATADDLAPNTQYTFTLFANGVDGKAVATRSVSATTSSSDGTTAAYALAPNTIVPTDFAALKATPLGNSRVSVTLTSTNDTRGSTTAIPGVDASALSGGCVPGLPLLVSTKVAGDQAFYGLIESCGATPPSLRAVTAVGATVDAVVDTNVPLAAVFPYVSFHSVQHHDCYDENGTRLADNAPLCAGVDTDGDGMKDVTEKALGYNPNDASDGWRAWQAQSKPQTATPATTPVPVGELQPPDGLGNGDVQVTLLWSTGDDLDLSVADPSGTTIDYTNKTPPGSGGELDADDRGDDTCQSADTRAENVYWKQAAPLGTYTVKVANYLGEGSEARKACGTKVQARLEVRIGGKLTQAKVITIGVDAPLTFKVAASNPYAQTLPAAGSLKDPTGLGTGDVQVTLLWATGDFLDLVVTDPTGAELSDGSAPSASGGQIDRSAPRNDSCGIFRTRAANTVWKTKAPAGTYTIAIDHYVKYDDQARPDNPCTSAPLQGRLEVRVGGKLIQDRIVTADAEGPITFAVSATPPFDQPVSLPDLQLPATALTGRLQISLLWSSNDSLSLDVTDPKAGEVSPQSPSTATGGVYAESAAQASCSATPATRFDQVIWKAGSPPGAYTVKVKRDSPTCGGATRTEAWLEIRLRGTLILRQYVVIPSDALGGSGAVIPVAFTAPTEAPGWRAPASAQAVPAPARTTSLAQLAAKPSVKCAKSGSSTFDPGFYFGEFQDVDFHLDRATLNWKIRIGVNAGINPEVSVTGEVSCELELPSMTYQLTAVPVPINLELKPVVSGSVGGKFTLSGPSVDAAFGVESTGHVGPKFQYCNLWILGKFPCGLELDYGAEAHPFGEFTKQTLKLSAEGKISVGVGIEATIGVGIKNAFVTSSSGFQMTLRPAVATATVTAGLTPLPLTGKVQPYGTTAPPPYTRDQTRAIWLTQSKTAPIYTPNYLITSGPAPLVGPVVNGHCAGLEQPGFQSIPVSSLGGRRSVYTCADAQCLANSVESYHGGEINTSNTVSTSGHCVLARCLLGQEIVTVNDLTNKNEDAGALCPQGDVTDPVETFAGASGPEASLCAQLSLGGDLAVNFIAQAWVLAWGEDKTFPLYDHSYTYPNAEWAFGRCE